MEIDNNITSDCAALGDIVDALFKGGISVRTMRDVTRGGLGTVINEIAESSAVKIELQEESIPVNSEVKGFADILGLDPLYMGNEGKMIAVVPSGEPIALEIMKTRSTCRCRRDRMCGRGTGCILKTRLGPPGASIAVRRGSAENLLAGVRILSADFFLDAADYENLAESAECQDSPPEHRRLVNSAVNSGESYSKHKNIITAERTIRSFLLVTVLFIATE